MENDDISFDDQREGEVYLHYRFCSARRRPQLLRFWSWLPRVTLRMRSSVDSIVHEVLRARLNYWRKEEVAVFPGSEREKREAIPVEVCHLGAMYRCIDIDSLNNSDIRICSSDIFHAEFAAT